MTIYINYPKDFTRKLPWLTSPFNKIAGYPTHKNQ